MQKRSFADEKNFIEQISTCKYRIKSGFVPNMNVDGIFYVNNHLKDLMYEELEDFSSSGAQGGFIPAVKQIANVASLPGIVGASLGMPDIHSGYGFAIGNVAAFDTADAQAVVSPGGVGFDINCLAAGTKVALADGTSCPIEAVPIGVEVLSLAESGQGLIPKKVTACLDRGTKECIELMFFDGRTLVCTRDHLLRSADGEWVTAGDAEIGMPIAAGVEYPTIDRNEDGAGWELDLTDALDLHLDMAEHRVHALAFARLLGYLLTDGTVTRSATRIDSKLNLGHQLDVASARADVLLLTGKLATVHTEGNTFALYIPAALTSAFASVGVDIGARVNCVTHLPAFVLDTRCPLPLVRAFLSGYFGGDGHTAALGHLADGRVLMTTIGFSVGRMGSVAAEQLEVLKLELGGLLNRCGITTAELSWFAETQVTNITKRGKDEIKRRKQAGSKLGQRVDVHTVHMEDRVQLKVELSRAATIKFAEHIGFAHCCHKQLRLSAAVIAFRAQALVGAQRAALVEAVDKMSVGTLGEKIASAKESLSHQEMLHPLVETWNPTRRAHMYPTSRGAEGLKLADVLCATNTRNFFSPKRTKSKYSVAAAAAIVEAEESDASRVVYAVPRSVHHLPLLQLPIVAKRSVGLKHVYDLCIDEETPSFTACGIVVHNCGVRLLRTNLSFDDVKDCREQLAQALFDHIPVGVGSEGVIPTQMRDLDEALEMGVDWSLREGYAWAEDKEHCEEFGRMLAADGSKVSVRAKKRGLPQLGTLGAGNHYAEVQVVDEIYDRAAAARMGIEQAQQICILIHSGSRGLGHQVATDALVHMEKAMASDKIALNDRQLACARIASAQGQDYLSAMAAAANYAWVNRQSMTFLVRQAFAKMFHSTPDDLDMHVVYDVSHNIAKIEEHMVNGRPRSLLVHRKGATRAFPPHHPLIPVDYQFTGQPVLVGGTMGTCSYVLTGTEQGMTETFGSTCHGAGRALSRNASRKSLGYQEVLQSLADKGISIRVASPKLVTEEAPESYKDVTQVVETCHQAGISKKCVKLRPIAVIKG